MDANPHFPTDLARLLSGLYPASSPNLARLLGSGWNADAWRVPERGGDLVVRIPRRDWARGEIERQACLAARLAARGIPAPREWALLRDPGGRVYAGVYRFVAGEPAPARGRAAGALAPLVANLLERIHQFPASEAVACGAEQLDPWEGRWRPIFERHAAGLGPGTRAWVERAAERLEALSLGAGAPALIHGDLQPAHLILRADSSVAAVLDFSGPTVSDRAIDFGRLTQFWGARFAERVLQAYTLSVDGAFVERAHLYAALEPLRTIALEAEMGTAVWTGWAKRKLAARARARALPGG